MSECKQHGQYLFSPEGCPVCAGRSTGRSWAIEASAKLTRSRAELNEDANADEETVGTSQRWAPELDRAWRGE